MQTTLELNITGVHLSAISGLVCPKASATGGGLYHPDRRTAEFEIQCASHLVLLPPFTGHNCLHKHVRVLN